MNEQSEQLKKDHSDRMEEVFFAGKVPVTIFEFRRHSHDFVSGWETQYLDELIKMLKPGMIVFDIGAEQGEFTVMAAKIVGGENVHIFEPSTSYWPNIKKIWEANSLNNPGSCFQGFISSRVKFMNYESIPGNWPKCSDGEIFYGTNQVVTHSKENTGVETISLDFYSELKHSIPDVIMIDCEGAEVDIIDGAQYLLKENSPTIFISIHSEETIAMYGRTKQELFDILNKLNYDGTFIYKDHEEHWKFTKKS